MNATSNALHTRNSGRNSDDVIERVRFAARFLFLFQSRVFYNKPIHEVLREGHIQCGNLSCGSDVDSFLSLGVGGKNEMTSRVFYRIH